jgi:hypothetical protein
MSACSGAANSPSRAVGSELAVALSVHLPAPGRRWAWDAR